MRSNSSRSRRCSSSVEMAIATWCTVPRPLTAASASGSTTMSMAWPGPSPPDGDARPVLGFVDDPVAEQSRHQLERAAQRADGHRHAVQPSNRLARADAVARPRRPRIAIARRPARTTARTDRRSGWPLRRSGSRRPGRPRRASFNRRRQKPSDAAGTENDVVTTWPAPFHADAHAAALVRERRPDRAGRAAFGAVVEVVDVVVVEVDGLLDEPQAEQIEAEIQIGLRVVDRRRDVMQTENRVGHRSILQTSRPFSHAATVKLAPHGRGGAGSRPIPDRVG